MEDEELKGLCDRLRINSIALLILTAVNVGMMIYSIIVDRKYFTGAGSEANVAALVITGTLTALAAVSQLFVALGYLKMSKTTVRKGGPIVWNKVMFIIVLANIGFFVYSRLKGGSDSFITLILLVVELVVYGQFWLLDGKISDYME